MFTTPYSSITTYTIQTSPASCTANSGTRISAPSRFSVTSSGRRRTRSTTSPASGAATAGARKKKKTRPAAPLLPVRDFTQMPQAIHIELSPSSDKVWPARYRRASDRDSSRR
jgi:hypothetical protein